MNKLTLKDENFEIRDSIMIKFNGNTSSVTIPDGVIAIAKDAFSYNNCIHEIILPKTLKSIGAFSFQYCTNLEKIIIPDEIEFVDGSAFNGCNNLNYSYCNNIKYIGNSFNSFLILLEVIDKSCLIYDINCKTKIICNNAFCYCENLKSIVIPNDVSFIGDNAFSNCYSLESVLMCNNVQKIGASVFSKCKMLTKINISESLTIINNNTFRDCINLKTLNLPQTIKTIGESSFSGCRSLVKINIPEYIEKIDYCAFNDCDKLTNLIIPNSIKSIGEYAFPRANFIYNTYKNARYVGNNENKYLALVKIIDRCTGCEIHENTKLICGGAFSHSNLKNIVIPANIKSIGVNAFGSCQLLEIVTFIGKDIVLEDYAFNKCEHLTQINTCSFKIIGNNCFSHCKRITSLTIEGNIQKIGVSAFSNCYNLEKVELKNGIKSIAAAAFQECNALKQIDIPNSVISIGRYAFSGCSALKHLIIPDSVVKIEKNAFANCEIDDIYIPDQKNIFEVERGILKNYNYLGYEQFVQIPDGITSIQEHVFKDCNKLKTILLPNSIIEASRENFLNTTSYINGERYPCTSLKYNSYDNAEYLGNHNNPYLILVKAKDRIKTCSIHQETKVICKHAFYNSLIEKIAIPTGIKKIDNETFLGCIWLREIELNKNLCQIKEDAFKGCHNLKILYQGSKEDWQKTMIENNNNPLIAAEIFFQK